MLHISAQIAAIVVVLLIIGFVGCKVYQLVMNRKKTKEVEELARTCERVAQVIRGIIPNSEYNDILTLITAASAAYKAGHTLSEDNRSPTAQFYVNTALQHRARRLKAAATRQTAFAKKVEALSGGRSGKLSTAGLQGLGTEKIVNEENIRQRQIDFWSLHADVKSLQFPVKDGYRDYLP